MSPAPTTFTGPLGSTFHVLRADADTVAALAAIDWRRRFRRVCLDPVRGVITLMSPSRLHEDLTTMLGDIVDVAAEILSGAGRGIARRRGSVRRGHRLLRTPGPASRRPRAGDCLVGPPGLTDRKAHGYHSES